MVEESSKGEESMADGRESVDGSAAATDVHPQLELAKKLVAGLKIWISSLFAYVAISWRFWCRWIGWLIAFVTGNVAAFAFIVASSSDEDSERHDEYTMAKEARMGLLWMGMLFLVDFILLYAASQHVQKEREFLQAAQDEQDTQKEGEDTTTTPVNNNALNNGDENDDDNDDDANPTSTPATPATTGESSFWEPIHVCGKTSQLFDRFFGQQQQQSIHSKVPFLVSLLLALGGLSLSASAMCFSESAYYHILLIISPTCLQPSPSDEKGPELAKVGMPPGMHQWASERYMDDGASRLNNYAHFPSRKTTFFVVNSETAGYSHSTLPILFSTGQDGALSIHSNITNPRRFVSIYDEDGKEENDERKGFCCEYIPRDVWEGRNRRPEEYEAYRRHILCYYQGKIHEILWTPSLTTISDLPHHSYYSYMDMGQMEMKWTGEDESTVWLRQLLHLRGGIYIVIGKLDIGTMQVKDHTAAILDFQENFRGYDGCYETLQVFTFLSACILSSIGIAYWLLKVRGVPSGLSPACFFVTIFFRGLGNFEAGICSFLLCLLAFMVTIGILIGKPKFLTRNVLRRETVVWCLYTSLLTLALTIALFGSPIFFDPFYGEVGTFLLVLLTSVMIGILLNHPILQVVGFLGLILAMFIGMTAFFFNGVMSVVIAMVIGFVSCGMIYLGNYIQQNAGFVTYTKHMLRRLLADIHQHSGQMIHETSELV